MATGGRPRSQRTWHSKPLIGEAVGVVPKSQRQPLTSPLRGPPPSPRLREEGRFGHRAMIVQGILFYIFGAVAVASGVFVVSARNPVHSVLFLILAFFNAAGLFVLIGAEFLAMILVIVYVGAVAVLFLFVVMMLDIDFVELRSGFVRYLPIGSAIGVVLLAELLFLDVSWVGAPGGASPSATGGVALTNTRGLGDILYTRYLFAFQVAGLILLVAMVGAIVLTLRHRADVRRQSISAQLARRRSDAVDVIKVPVGSGS